MHDPTTVPSILSVSSIAAIIGMITGIAGLIFGLLGYVRSRGEIVQTFLTELRSPEQIAARKHIYGGQDFLMTDETASLLTNFYHHWGLMVKHGYLPLWAFEANELRTIEVYEKLLPFIEKMREQNENPLYAYGFQWLREKLARRLEKKTRAGK